MKTLRLVGRLVWMSNSSPVIREEFDFQMFQVEGESEKHFEMRVWRWSTQWCELCVEEDIPKEGPLRNVWRMYNFIKDTPTDELVEDYRSALGDEQQCWGNMEGEYCRAWIDLARAELDRRKSSELQCNEDSSHNRDASVGDVL